jgi:DNA polymerase-1
MLLATLYGQGMARLCHDLGITEKQGYALRDAVFSPMPRVQALVKRTKTIGDVHGCIFTLSGRIVPVDARATYRATNYLVQGSAYDVLAESMLAVHDAGLGDALYFALHDELVVSESAAHDVRKIMETPPQRLIELAGRVPVLRTDMAVMGERWASV